MTRRNLNKQDTIDNTNRHHIQWLNAVRLAEKWKHITSYQAQKLIREYEEDLKNNGGVNANRSIPR